LRRGGGADGGQPSEHEKEKVPGLVKASRALFSNPLNLNHVLAWPVAPPPLAAAPDPQELKELAQPEEVEGLPVAVNEEEEAFLIAQPPGAAHTITRRG
jgi:hypothetical protein